MASVRPRRGRGRWIGFGILPAALVLWVFAMTGAGCGPGDAPDDFFFFRLEEGTPVSLEITAIHAAPEASVSMKMRDAILSQPGDSALIGVALEGLHTHPEWLATVAGGEDVDDGLAISFKLTTTSPLYEESDEFTAIFEIEHDHHDDGGHGDDEDAHDDGDIIIASTQPRGGKLTLRYDFAALPVELFFDQCIGGVGEECEGGIVLYSNTDPGFAPLE